MPKNKQPQFSRSTMTKGKNEVGILVWITGLPGSGKTTLAKKIYEDVKNKYPCVMIDGDHLREIMGQDLGYTKKDRLINAYRIAKLNKHLVDNNIIVICSTVSLFKEIHEWNRSYIKNLLEIYIEVPMEILIKRNPKKIYSRALKGKLKNVYGVNQRFDIPPQPHLIIKNAGKLHSFLKKAGEIKSRINVFKRHDK